MRNFAFFLLLIGSSGGALWCQNINFKSFTRDDGLAQSQVQSLYQDKEGFLWVATLGGLSRFDGQRFTNFPELASNVCYKLPDGTMLLGVKGGIIKVKNGQTIPLYFKEPYGQFSVTDILEKDTTSLLLATDGLGLVTFDWHSDQYVYQNVDSKIPLHVRCLTYFDHQILLGTTQGLYRYSSQKAEKVMEVGDVSIKKIACDANGGYWLATYGDGVFYCKDKSIKQLNSDSGLVSDWVRDVVLDDQEVYFVSKKGLSFLNSKGKLHNTTMLGDVPLNLRCGLKDSEGNIWFGGDGIGLLKHSGKHFSNYTISDGIGSNQIMSFYEHQNGEMFFGSHNNGISRYNFSSRKGGTIDFQNNTIWCMLQDKDSLYVGTSNGVQVLSLKNKKANSKILLPGKKIYQIQKDNKGNFWMGTSKGIVRINNGGKAQTYSAFRGFNIDKVKGLLVEENKVLFACNIGLLTYNGQYFKRYKFDQSRQVLATCIDKDLQGRIWVGSSAGLYLFEKQQLKKVDVPEMGFGEYVTFVKVNKNILWVGTDYGLFAVALDSVQNIVKSRKFGVQEGLINSECNQNGVYKDVNGDLWVGTSKGVVKIEADFNPFNTADIIPVVKVEKMLLFLEEVDWQKMGVGEDREALPKKLQLKHHQNHLTFVFKSVYLSNPAKVEYSFRLLGFEENWSPALNTERATYSNLSHNKYVFQVKSRLIGGLWSKPDSYAFSISPAYWQTLWFRLLVSVAILMGFYLFYRSRKLLLERKRLNEKLDYEAKMSNLEQQILNTSMNRHFVFNSLNSIQYYINKKDVLSANRFLTSFAKLIRKNLDATQTNFVSLYEEIDRIKLYLQLENMRFEDEFTYDIQVDKNLSLEEIRIPSMLLQPFIENSIIHGILPLKDKKGLVEVKVNKKEHYLWIQIDDNGIGIQHSLSKKNPNDHTSKGMALTQERLQLFNKNSIKPFEIIGPYERIENGAVVGTRVEIKIPLE